MGNRDIVRVDNNHGSKNVYYSVDIAVSLILHYQSAFQNILDEWHSEYCFEETSFPYDRMTAEHDIAWMRLFDSAVWEYLDQLLGNEETSVLYHYFVSRMHREANPPMYVDALLQFFLHHAGSLDKESVKELIIYTAYQMMNPGDTASNSREMKPCHDQFQRVKKSLREKLSVVLPTLSRFYQQLDRYFAGETAKSPGRHVKMSVGGDLLSHISA